MQVKMIYLYLIFCKGIRSLEMLGLGTWIVKVTPTKRLTARSVPMFYKYVVSIFVYFLLFGLGGRLLLQNQ